MFPFLALVKLITSVEPENEKQPQISDFLEDGNIKSVSGEVRCYFVPRESCKTHFR